MKMLEFGDLLGDLLGDLRFNVSAAIVGADRCCHLYLPIIV